MKNKRSTSKKLSEMTLEELWQLFPIFLTEHDPSWSEQYDEEASELKKLLPSGVVFHHIGSTAIDGIMAKPIIDMIVAVDSRERAQEVASILQAHWYILMSASADRISLNKGYTENGFADRVFHLHVRLKNDVDEIYFRDYLNANPQIAKEYEALKLSLWKKYEHDRDAYTDAKTEFVKRFTEIAKNDGTIPQK